MPNIDGVSYGIADRTIPADGVLVSLAEHFDSFLLDWQMKHPSVMRDRFPLGEFPLYSGYSQKSYIFRGTLGPQDGLADWSPIEPSSKPDGQDAGYDRCSYNPQTYTWAMDQIDYSGLKTSWRSPVFCVNDLKFHDKAQQQLGLIIKAGSQITDAVKETFNREIYVKTAADNGKFIALADSAALDYIDNDTVRVTYDPFTEDADGDTYITFDSTVLPRLSTLNWSQLDIVRQYLSDQCPDAAQSMDSGMPIFGLMLDLNDFERFVLGDSDLRDDFRYAKPQQLISGFNMGFKTYRGFMIMHDMRQMRFKADRINDDGDVVCKRVRPRRATREGMIGYIPETNPDYVTAELGTAILFLKDTIQILVPSVVSSLGSGMTFGPAPNFSGQWSWVNNATDTNPLREVGYFFSRYEYFTKALQYAQEVTVLLYRRCTHTIRTMCAIQSHDDAAALAYPDTIPAAGDFDQTNRTVVLSLANLITGGVSDSVAITNDAGQDFVAYIVEDSDAPVYKFAWKTGATNAPTAVTDINDITITKVTVT